MRKQVSDELSTYINAITKGRSPFPVGVKIFLSSTKRDLEEERLAVIQLMDKLGLSTYVMENFGARSESPLQTCLSELEKSQIYIGIFSMRYGTLYTNTDNETDSGKKSFTEIEYDTAFKKGLRILIYCIDDEIGSVHPNDIDFENWDKLKLLKDTLKKRHTIDMYSDTRDLLDKVLRDVSREIGTMLGSRETIGSLDGEQFGNSEQPSFVGSSNIQIPDITLSIDEKKSYNLSEFIRIIGTSVHPSSSFVYVYLITGDTDLSSYPEIPKSSICSLDPSGADCLKLPVLQDHTWGIRFSLTSLVGTIESGDYQLLATQRPLDADPKLLSTSKYASMRIRINTPSLSLVSSYYLAIPGVPYFLRGTADTICPNIYLWICDRNKVIFHSAISLANDGTYEYEIPYNLISQLIPGTRYDCLLQMPIVRNDGVIQFFQSSNGCSIAKVQPDGKPDPSECIYQDQLEDHRSLIDEITRLMDNTNGQDVYSKFTFMRENPKIEFVELTDDSHRITIYGQTNLPPGSELSMKLYYPDGESLPPAKVLEKHFGVSQQRDTYNLAVMVQKAEYPLIPSSFVEISLRSTGDVLYHQSF